MDETTKLIEGATTAVMEEQPDTFKQRLSLFARLENVRRELDDRLKAVKRRADAMKESLLEEMAENGIDSANVHGLSVFSRTDLFVNKKANADGVTTQMVCDVLEALGRGDMVSDGYSGSSLKSLVREIQGDDGDGVPEQLENLLNISRVAVLTTRKA